MSALFDNFDSSVPCGVAALQNMMIAAVACGGRGGGAARAVFALTLAVALALLADRAQGNISGAVWTTTQDNSVVDGNIYASRYDVYLNGGPHNGDCASASAGLPDDTYVFMVRRLGTPAPRAQPRRAAAAIVCRQRAPHRQSMTGKMTFVIFD
jgi:hypothetical protein